MVVTSRLWLIPILKRSVSKDEELLVSVLVRFLHYPVPLADSLPIDTPIGKRGVQL
jgi:hypothetical protein